MQTMDFYFARGRWRPHAGLLVHVLCGGSATGRAGPALGVGLSPVSARYAYSLLALYTASMPLEWGAGCSSGGESLKRDGRAPSALDTRRGPFSGWIRP